MARRKKYADYLEAIIAPESSKWVTDGFTRDRRIALYGIDVCVTQELDGKTSVSPVIPCAGPLAKLVRKTKATAFRFNRKRRKWTQA